MPVPSVLAVIPARYGSTRFPGKPLALIAGKPMIQRVYERAQQAHSLDRIIVATDDERIVSVVKNFGGEAVLTRSDHATGTDRLVEVVHEHPCDWVLNIQGDEPLISPDDLNELVYRAKARPGTNVATLIHALDEEARFQDSNVVKVVLNHRSEALYFSRAPIPFHRESQGINWKHVGVYLYRREFLLAFHQWPRSRLELTEQLEQLRILENGHSIFCVVAKQEGVGVDTPADVVRAEAFIAEAQALGL